jgi:hypothetical protein
MVTTKDFVLVVKIVRVDNLLFFLFDLNLKIIGVAHKLRPTYYDRDSMVKITSSHAIGVIWYREELCSTLF